MALRTFHSNPGLGGFGGTIPDSRRSYAVDDEPAQSDAFLQILKELLDNAVDACSSANKVDASSPQGKRVRVAIERYDPSGDLLTAEPRELLRVSVSDNGVGMDDIQRSVNAFSSSKQHHSPPDGVRKSLVGADDPSTTQAPEEAHTYGRYGIGLTLSILHGQRLVPNSSAQITSATPSSSHWTSTVWIADVSDDSIKCIKQWHVAKTKPESGTKVSLLLPGGATAERAWPRLQEYIRRFHFSINLSCKIEVLAPTLSKVPIYVIPPTIEEEREHIHGNHSNGGSTDCETWRQPQVQLQRVIMQTHLQAFQAAAQRYISQPVELKDIAYSLNPIRLDPSRPLDPQGPYLEIALIVAEAADEDEFDAAANDDWAIKAGTGLGARDSSARIRAEEATALTCGRIHLIRIVNGIPLLDTWEALACGIVHNLATLRQVWLSFGLDVSVSHQTRDAMVMPRLDVRDSAQVLPFLARGSHELFDVVSDENSEASSYHHDSGLIGTKPDRRRKGQRSDFRNVRPAKDRFAKTFMIVHIHGRPSVLPLSTLSKGRLPVENPAINAALELSLTQCLRTLQQSNPLLLLSANVLLSSERDARYVPLLASAVTSIVCHFESRPNRLLLGRIRSWRAGGSDSQSDSSESPGSTSASEASDTERSDETSDRSQNCTNVAFRALVNLMEDRIRRRLQDMQDRAGGTRKTNKNDASGSDADSDQETSSQKMSSLNFFFASSSDNEEESDDGSSVRGGGDVAEDRDAAGARGGEAMIRPFDEADDWF